MIAVGLVLTGAIVLIGLIIVGGGIMYDWLNRYQLTWSDVGDKFVVVLPGIVTAVAVIWVLVGSVTLLLSVLGVPL